VISRTRIAVIATLMAVAAVGILLHAAAGSQRHDVTSEFEAWILDRSATGFAPLREANFIDGTAGFDAAFVFGCHDSPARALHRAGVAGWWRAPWAMPRSDSVFLLVFVREKELFAYAYVGSGRVVLDPALPRTSLHQGSDLDWRIGPGGYDPFLGFLTTVTPGLAAR
jgi:hypothetical protein